MTPESAKLLKLMRNALALINVVIFLMVAFMVMNGAPLTILLLLLAQFVGMYFVFRAIQKELKKYGQQQNHAAPEVGLEDHAP